MPEKKLILDTCALLWIAGGLKKISESTARIIQDAPIVFVSAISAWEISLKYARKQLVLPMMPELWFYKVVEAHSLVVAPLDVTVLCNANTLPWYHKDTADRFIIATALLENAAIVTADEKFSDYDVRIVC